MANTPIRVEPLGKYGLRLYGATASELILAQKALSPGEQVHCIGPRVLSEDYCEHDIEYDTQDARDTAIKAAKHGLDIEYRGRPTSKPEIVITEEWSDEMASATKQGKKKAAAKKVRKPEERKVAQREGTLGHLVDTMLGNGATDEAITKAAAVQYPDHKFNQHQTAQLSWYKWRYRKNHPGSNIPLLRKGPKPTTKKATTKKATTKKATTKKATTKKATTKKATTKKATTKKATTKKATTKKATTKKATTKKATTKKATKAN